MYFFDKKVIYLVWKMTEGQARGVGTVRFLVMDGVCRIEVAVTGCGKVRGTYPVYLLSGDVESLLEEITLTEGKGTLNLRCNTKMLGHQAIPYTQVTGIRIDLKTEGCLEQKWLPQKSEQQAVPKTPQVVRVAEESQTPMQEAIHEPPRPMPEEINEPPRPMPQEINEPPKQQRMSLYPNKWQQLCAIYPMVNPFGDGRAYLSIEPRDFVVLQERYHPMVQNSFLLHSFYHYKYILLGRQKQGRNVQYYLGVPGVFYEKEKAAALFYGFESFESAVTPATEGSFGYYLKRVQI